MTDGYTPGHMITAVQQVLTERRVQSLSKKPLQSVEFIAPLARLDPIYKEEEDAFKVFISHIILQQPCQLFQSNSLYKPIKRLLGKWIFGGNLLQAWFL